MPSSPPLASRPSASTASDQTRLPCERTTGSPIPSLRPELDLAVVAAAGQPPVRQHRQGPDPAAVREDHGLARTVLGPELDLAVCAAAGQPPVRQHRQGQDPAAVREDHRLAHTVLGPELDLAVCRRRWPAARPPAPPGTGPGCRAARTTGSPIPSLGQSLILPSSPPLASRPSASTARDRTAAAVREDHRLARTVLGPELDLAVVAAAGQPPVRQHRQRPDRAAVREDHRLARTVLGPELDLAVVAAAGQPPVRQHRQGPDRAAVREDHRLARAVLAARA